MGIFKHASGIGDSYMVYTTTTLVSSIELSRRWLVSLTVWFWFWVAATNTQIVSDQNSQMESHLFYNMSWSLCFGVFLNIIFISLISLIPRLNHYHLYDCDELGCNPGRQLGIYLLITYRFLSPSNFSEKKKKK